MNAGADQLRGRGASSPPPSPDAEGGIGDSPPPTPPTQAQPQSGWMYAETDNWWSKMAEGKNVPTEAGTTSEPVAALSPMNLKAEDIYWVDGFVVKNHTCCNVDTDCQGGLITVKSLCQQKSCPCCAAHHYKEQGWEVASGFKVAAAAAIEAIANFDKANPGEIKRVAELMTTEGCARFLLLIAKIFNTTGLDKGISHYGAVGVPRKDVESLCQQSRLGEYYVQKKWNTDRKTFSYM